MEAESIFNRGHTLVPTAAEVTVSLVIILTDIRSKCRVTRKHVLYSWNVCHEYLFLCGEYAEGSTWHDLYVYPRK